MTRSEFVNYLAESLEDVSDIARYMMFVESVFAFDNSLGLKVYVLEVDDSVTAEDIKYLNDAFLEIGVSACLVPKDMLKYKATLTEESIHE